MDDMDWDNVWLEKRGINWRVHGDLGKPAGLDRYLCTSAYIVHSTMGRLWRLCVLDEY